MAAITTTPGPPPVSEPTEPSPSRPVGLSRVLDAVIEELGVGPDSNGWLPPLIARCLLELRRTVLDSAQPVHIPGFGTFRRKDYPERRRYSFQAGIYVTEPA